MTAAVGLDPRHSSDAELFRKRVRQFLDDHLPADWQGIGAIADRDEADRFVERGGRRSPPTGSSASRGRRSTAEPD